jgi:micrococcal nuclease
MRRTQLYYLFFIIFVLCSTYLFTRHINSKEYEVLKVVDGDTVILNDGLKTYLRYIGINSPEILTHESPGEPFSSAARQLNEKLLQGKKIKLEFDRERYDQYGRMLAYIFVGELFVNEQIVRNGLATSLKIKPNIKYIDRIQKAEEEAKKHRRGIWSDKANFISPKENREFFIKPHQAGRYIGQRVVTAGKITNFRKSEKVIVLKMDGDFDVIIFSNSWKNFNFFGIEPQSDYIGFPVEVIGRVKQYKGKPQIVVNHPITLKKLL